MRAKTNFKGWQVPRKRDSLGRAMSIPLEIRFWEKVDTDGTIPAHNQELGKCWVWRAAIGIGGYGQIYVCGRLQPAHKISYLMAGKKIPEGLEIDHLCRNHACVNPNHLEAVTRRINTLRGIGPTAINAKKTICKRGHALTGDNVYLRKNRRQRECRTCKRLTFNAWYAERRSHEKDD